MKAKVEDSEFQNIDLEVITEYFIKLVGKNVTLVYKNFMLSSHCLILYINFHYIIIGKEQSHVPQTYIEVMIIQELDLTLKLYEYDYPCTMYNI